MDGAAVCTAPRGDVGRSSASVDRRVGATLSSSRGEIHPRRKRGSIGHATSAAEWANSKGLRISLNKSSVTLFTPWTKQSNHRPDVSLGNHPLLLEKFPKILGVTFDTHFNFSTHVKNIITRAAPRINLLKAVAGSTWGHDRDTVLLIFKSRP